MDPTSEDAIVAALEGLAVNMNKLVESMESIRQILTTQRQRLDAIERHQREASPIRLRV
jgi:hypothetical protein